MGSSKPPLAADGMRIGVLGGSFNPAHDGHRHISLWALKRLGLDRVWWSLTPGNPLKSRAELAALGERLAEAGRAARHPRIVVTGFEAALGFAYTVETAAYLDRRRPGARFVWLMGADSFAGLHRWRAWRRLMALLPVAVFDRPGWGLKALASPAAHAFARYRLDENDARLLPELAAPAWTFLTVPLSSLSSTAVRAKSMAGKAKSAASRRN